MAKNMVSSLAALKELVGQEVGLSEWFTVAQDRIQQFADATLDHQWIHVDVERARRESPYESPIAHGFLTLSLLPHFMHEALGIAENLRMGVNYGLNRVRFTSPVPSGSRVRARFTLQKFEKLADGGIQVTWNVVLEREGGDKPVLVAEWLGRHYY